MSDLHKYNLPYEEVIRHINTILEANAHYYRSIQIRCVAAAQNGMWRNVLCLIRVQPSEIPHALLGSRRYRNVHLLESRLDLSHLPQLLREMPTGNLAIDGESIYVGDHPEFHHWALEPSNNDYADLPGYMFQSNQSSLTSALQQEPLVDFALPYYRDVYDAARDWAGLRRFHYFTDARIGYVWLFMPECRARLQEIKTSGVRLRIKIARGDHHIADELRLTGSWKTANGPVPISLPVSRPTLSVEIPKRATDVDLLLVNQTGDILDYHRETQFWTQGKGRILSLSRETRYEGLDVESEVTGDRSKRVFIVHGHDEANLLRLEKLLKEGFGLEPVILRFQPGKGRTLIEKFEEEAHQCNFAFVLMSPDDYVRVSRKGRKGYVQARPNVLFEMGWLCRHLNRDRVCILCKRGTKIHSDLEGVERIEFRQTVEEVVPKIERELEAAELLRPK
jgi:hypothetical protein